MFGLEFGSTAWWVGFNVFVIAMLALDLGIVNRSAKDVSLKEAGTWTAIWITLALLFNVLLYFEIGKTRALEFTAGYLIELSLSVDNIFVFLIIFKYFAVPRKARHRVLFWGVLGALIMRAFMIFAGVLLLSRFEWLIYVFGAFLVFTGLKMLKHGDTEIHPEHNPLLKLVRRLIPMDKDYEGARFFTMRQGTRVATPLLAVLVMIETTDVVFALDSIPAIFAITRDPLIIFTSNIFAILGLRSMFFLVAGVMDRFVYLNVGLAIVLSFVGLKMLLEHFIPISITVSLTVVGVVLLSSIVASLIKTRKGQIPPG